jgi:hypothetical protein
MIDIRDSHDPQWCRYTELAGEQVLGSCPTSSIGAGPVANRILKFEAENVTFRAE